MWAISPDGFVLSCSELCRESLAIARQPLSVLGSYRSQDRSPCAGYTATFPIFLPLWTSAAHYGSISAESFSKQLWRQPLEITQSV